MNEIWFRHNYLKYLVNKEISLTVREGKRDNSHAKGYKIGERLLARCFDTPGVNEFRTNIIITDLVFCKVKDLRDKDLAGGPPDALTGESAIRALEFIYSRKFYEDDYVTLVKFNYL